MYTYTNLFPDCVKLIGYLTYAVNVGCLILKLVLHQKVRYLSLYYEYTEMSSYQLQNNDIFSIASIYKWKFCSMVRNLHTFTSTRFFCPKQNYIFFKTLRHFTSFEICVQCFCRSLYNLQIGTKWRHKTVFL